MEHIIKVVIGLIALIFNKQLARLVIASQNKTWGFKFGSTEINAARIAIVGFGIFLILTAVRKYLSL